MPPSPVVAPRGSGQASGALSDGGSSLRSRAKSSCLIDGVRPRRPSSRHSSTAQRGRGRWWKSVHWAWVVSSDGREQPRSAGPCALGVESVHVSWCHRRGWAVKLISGCAPPRQVTRTLPLVFIRRGLARCGVRARRGVKVRVHGFRPAACGDTALAAAQFQLVARRRMAQDPAPVRRSRHAWPRRQPSSKDRGRCHAARGDDPWNMAPSPLAVAVSSAVSSSPAMRLARKYFGHFRAS